MKLKVQQSLLLSESMARLFDPLFQFFRELCQFLQFSKYSFGEICSQHLTRFPYIDL